MPQTDHFDAAQAAERFRLAIEASTFAGISVTSSFGVASVAMGPTDSHQLVDFADQALYAAKKTGRNRVVRYDDMPADYLKSQVDAKTVPPAPAVEEPQPIAAPVPAEKRTTDKEVPIPYHAVTSLVAALAHRDPSTAEHSRRVADLCVLAAQGVVV